MAKAAPSRREERISMSSMFTLASWRVRSTWFLLLIIAFGITVAVVVASTIPLFSTVMTTAGLRSTLRSTPENTEITLNTMTQGVSTPIAHAVQKQFDPLFHQYLGNSIHLEQSALLSEDFSFSPAIPHTSITTYGTSMEQAAPHLTLVQGRLANGTTPAAHEIEVVMTPQSAQRLGLHVGSTFTLSLAYFEAASRIQQSVAARLVGLVQVASKDVAYWHGNDFNPFALVNEAAPATYQYTLLVPYNALLALFDQITAHAQSSAVFSPSLDGYTFLWYYRLDASQVTINNLDAFIHRFAALTSTMDSLYGNLENGSAYSIPSYPYLFHLNLTSALFSADNSPSILEQFRSRVAVARIPIGVFTLLSIALILFFVSLMTSVLLDRQLETIALLRSRGASRGQIFGALFLQDALLGGIALVIGLPLALLSTLFLAQRVLPVSALDASDFITRNPFLALLGVVGYALGVLLVALLTMSISLVFVARMDILSFRRDAARTNNRPLWQRLNLDIVAGVVALVGYAFSLYVTSVGNVLSNDAQVLIATPLTIVAPFFLIIGCLFLFLRLFPLLLRWGAYLAARGRSAVSLLAFAQIARSPRQSLRLTTLLALAVSFALFTLVYNATEAQHIQEIVNYETGADFSASLTMNNGLPQVLQQYRPIPGVLDVSAGNVTQGVGGTADISIGINAVDPSSFGHAVIWPSSHAYQQARPLLSQLVTLRNNTATADSAIPAIVDQATIHKLLLNVGSYFTLIVNNDPAQAIYCSIIGVVDRIPTINDGIAVAQKGSDLSPQGGILVDYQTYARVTVQKEQQDKTRTGPIEPPPINQLWLHTKDDVTSVTSVRTALNNPQYHLTQLVDRRLLFATLQSDPLYVILIGVLGLGTIATLLLALIGDLLTSWLSAYTRVTSFALLRALGITSRQVASMLTWEQAIVYGTGIVLGSAFGTLLIVSVIPAITFTNANSNLSNEQFFALQSALSTQFVVPPSLPFVLLILIAIYAIALTIMVRVTTQSTLSQVLRLNED